MTENWKPIPGFVGLYEVSDFGNFRKISGKSIATTISPHNGYSYVGLRKDNKTKNFRSHRMVLLAHVGAPKEGQQGCHTNGLRSDNRLVNLRWGSAKENYDDKVMHGTARGANPGSLHHNAKLSEFDVDEIFQLRSEGWLQKQIAERFAVTQSNISRILSSQTWRAQPDA